MKINLQEAEIYKALVEFISNQGIDITNKTVEVSLTAGRGANGHSAQIEITQSENSPVLPGTVETLENQAAIKPFSFEDDEGNA